MTTTTTINPARSPLEDAAQNLQTAIADLYVVIGRSKTAEELSHVQKVVHDLWVLMDACERTARRKLDTL